MKGDFSKWSFDPASNFTGVLYQQGRVELDQDGNADTQITSHLRRQFGEDVLGLGVAAVPASARDGLRVTAAATDGTSVHVILEAGRLYIDGLHFVLPGEGPVTLPADYFTPPVQEPAADPSSIDADVRDAVVLELTEQALNAFQVPDLLLEPALGGPDTTERMRIHYRLRLYRLADGEDCESIRDDLLDDFAAKGRLSATPAPNVVITGDCPVAAGGGFTGLEHRTFRIEVAAADAQGFARFKWSQFNGALVGRGTLNPAGDEVTIVANNQVIANTGLDSFYLEALRPTADGGRWEVVFTADATWVGGDTLSLANTAGTWPPGTPDRPSAFFRLWDGIVRISDFPTGLVEPNTLAYGIRLAFDPPQPASGFLNYREGDYWTLPARAAGVENNLDLWPSDDPPQGVVHHRAPLAELTWSGPPDVAIAAPDDIEDCRRIIPPLTMPPCCCTYTVGRWGNFPTIELAVQHLPASGGRICVLPGVHRANVQIVERRNITIEGCDQQTVVIPEDDNVDGALFTLVDCECIRLEHLTMVSLGGTCILARGTALGDLREIVVSHNRMQACTHAVRVVRGIDVTVASNRIRMIDKADGREAVWVMVEDATVKCNDIGVVPAGTVPPPEVPDEPEPPDPEDPCAELRLVYRFPAVLLPYIEAVFAILAVLFPVNPYRARGGIKVAGSSERVAIRDNRIIGGAGHGVVLGHSPGELGPAAPDESVEPVTLRHRDRTLWGSVIGPSGPIAGAAMVFTRTDGSGTVVTAATDSTGIFLVAATPGTYRVEIASPPGRRVSAVSSEATEEFGTFHRVTVAEVEISFDEALATIYEIEIDRNEIRAMGLSGIGVPLPQPSDADQPERDPLQRLAALLGQPVSDLQIRDNTIMGCRLNPVIGDLRAASQTFGLGGITLGLCEDVVIDGNRIQDNGRSYVDPVTGIFVRLGENLVIEHNRIVDNGPIDRAAGDDLNSGIRGGIVALAASFGLDEVFDPDVREQGFDTGREAMRIHGNVVKQPAGLALAVALIGPASITDNRFNAQYRDPGGLGLLVGGVLVLQSGGVGTSLPSGMTLFNGNQVRVGPENQSFIGQVFWMADDIGYDANQSMTRAPGLALANDVRIYLHCLMLAPTLRLTDSRFAERISSGDEDFIVSVISRSGQMNNTNDNQGDHCIFALSDAASHPADNHGNQIWDASRCPNLDRQVTRPITDVPMALAASTRG